MFLLQWGRQDKIIKWVGRLHVRRTRDGCYLHPEPSLSVNLLHTQGGFFNLRFLNKRAFLEFAKVITWVSLCESIAKISSDVMGAMVHAALRSSFTCGWSYYSETFGKKAAPLLSPKIPTTATGSRCSRSGHNRP